MTGQLEWNFDLLVEPVETETYTGRAPLHFTVAFLTLDEAADAAGEARRMCALNADEPWYPGRDFTNAWGHMWRIASLHESFPSPAGHDLITMQASLRCGCLMVPPWGFDTRECFCVGDLMHKTQCTPCGWQSIGTEADVVEAWHDHVWPGWRDLPVVPFALRPAGGGIDSKSKQAMAWVVANYPTEWQVTGAPVVTERDGLGTRHVPGYSPWGGFDLCTSRFTS